MHPSLKLLTIAATFLAFMFNRIEAQPLPDSTIKKIDAIFSFWKSDKSPGCAIGIIRNDSLIYANGYGLANLEYGIPITPSTIFHMASVSKQFTAYSIVLLAAAGKLKLDDDIRQYLPWFPDLKEKITIRHLLNHTSGIRDQWQLLAIAGTRIDDVITQDQIVKILSRQKALNFKPGERYSYSNSGFTMLAEIVKSVTGKTVRVFTDSAIFKPLGMSHTHFHDNYTEIEKNRAYSYQRESFLKFSNSVLSYSNAGATSLFTTINDLSKWVMNFYKPVAGTKMDIDQLVQKGKLNSGEELSYALGIVSDKYKGWRQYSHGGADAGYRTYISVFPDLKMGFIVFSNIGDFNSSEKTHKLADLFLKDSTGPQKEAEFKADTIKATIRNTAKIKSYAGEFIAEDGSQSSFALQNQKFYWVHSGQQDLLYPGAKDSFTVAKTPDVKFVFTSSTGGKLIAVECFPGGKSVLSRVITDTGKSEQELAVYSGVYYCPELDCKYNMEIKKGALMLTNSKYEDTKITFVGRDDLFTSNWWMPHLTMVRDSKNEITGFEVNGNRVMHLLFERIH